MKSRQDRRGLGAWLNDVIAPFAPSLALGREKAMAQRSALRAAASTYNAAGKSARSKDFHVNGSDAVEAMRAARYRLSWISRDMLRNNPRAVKIRRQLRNLIVGAGIRPSVSWIGDEITHQGVTDKQRVERLIKLHLMTTDFDADGRVNLLGMQGVVADAIVGDGEVLLRRRFRRSADGYSLPFQVQVLEADFLNEQIEGNLANGNTAVQGIEFDQRGRRVAYHLFKSHPGGRQGAMPATTRVDARNIIHAFDVTRPGQQRGVSWFAPVITLLHELQKYQDGQVKRQEIAAMFAAVFRSSEAAKELEGDIGQLAPGAMLTIGNEEEIDFTDPPSVDGYEAFMRVTDRAIAAGVGLTYEGYTGDYTGVNYSSARMGRMDTDPNVRDWQQNMMIAQVCAGIARWTQEAIQDVSDISQAGYDLDWTPPVRPVVDPTKDYKANEIAMRSGQKSRRQTIREGGGDPNATEAEIVDERDWENEKDLVLTSNAGASAPASEREGEKNENG